MTINKESFHRCVTACYIFVSDQAEFFDKMEKMVYRAEIKFLMKEGQTTNRIHDRLCAVFGEAALSKATVRNWVREF